MKKTIGESLENHFKTILKNIVSDEIIKELILVALDSERTELYIVKHALNNDTIDNTNEKINKFLDEIRTDFKKYNT